MRDTPKTLFRGRIKVGEANTSLFATAQQPLSRLNNMADMNGEAAFLASMGGDEYDPAHQQPQHEEPEEEDDDDDDYDPSSFMPDAPQESAPSVAPSATPQPAAPQLSQPPSQAPSQAPSRTASTQPNPTVQAAQKPKTIGGFIEEDDDDEEEAQDATVQHGANGALAVESQNTPLHTPQRDVTQTPSQLNTQVYNASNHLATSDVVSNGAAKAESVSTPTSTVPPQAVPSAEQKPATPAPQINPGASSLPAISSIQKPRLPQDRIGQLEDRILEDPKGDINAWLELISLHRQKNKLDDARAVYDRFFEYFPTAVS